MSTDITPFAPSTALADEINYAQTVSRASLLPAAYRGKPADVLVAVGLGNAIGIAPAQSLYEIYVVNGRPSPSANLMAGLVRRAGHKLRIEGDATRCTATLIRKDDPDAPFSATWTIEQARAAGLASKDTWKQYPAAMLRARAVSEVVRMGASEAVLGMDYSAEEMRDVEDHSPAPSAKPTGMAAVRAAVQVRSPEPVNEADDNTEDADVVEDAPKITPAQQRKLFALFKQKGIGEADQLPGIAHIVGRQVESRTALTADEFEAVIERLKSQPDALAQDAAEAGERGE